MHDANIKTILPMSSQVVCRAEIDFPCRFLLLPWKCARLRDSFNRHYVAGELFSLQTVRFD